MAWNVYLLYNERRRELFIGVTEKDVGAEFELNRAVPPAPVRHWDFESERVRVKALKRDLTKFEARNVVREFEGEDGWMLRKGV